jgi:hypothetical protein
MQLSQIGMPVQHYTTQYDVHSAALQAKHGLVVFTTDSDSGPTLAYHYDAGQWFTWAGYWSTARSVATAYDRLYSLHGASGVYYTDPDDRRDGSGFFAFTLETGEVTPNAFSALSRLRRIYVDGYAIANADLSIKVHMDGVPYWIDTRTYDASAGIGKTFDHAEYYGAGLDSTYRDKALLIEAVPSQQKCTSFRVQIKDVDPGSTPGETIELTGLSFEVAPTGRKRPLLGGDRQAG